MIKELHAAPPEKFTTPARTGVVDLPDEAGEETSHACSAGRLMVYISSHLLSDRLVLSSSSLHPDQIRLFEAYSSMAAQAIDRAQFAEQANPVQTLTATEKLQTARLNSIFKLLVRQASKVVTQCHLLRVNISNLRHKIERDPAQPHYILTESGVGYRLRTAD